MKVNLSGIPSLSKIEPEIVSEFIPKLKEATLYATKLTPMQLISLLSNLNKTEHDLQSLDLGGSNFSSISSQMIFKSIKNIQMVNLYFTKLSASQMIDILQSIIENDGIIKLKHLDIGGNSSNIPEDIVEKAQHKLTCLKILS